MKKPDTLFQFVCQWILALNLYFKIIICPIPGKNMPDIERRETNITSKKKQSWKYIYRMKLFRQIWGFPLFHIDAKRNIFPVKVRSHLIIS
jgi:hypothetical protein